MDPKTLTGALVLVSVPPESRQLARPPPEAVHGHPESHGERLPPRRGGRLLPSAPARRSRAVDQPEDPVDVLAASVAAGGGVGAEGEEAGGPVEDVPGEGRVPPGEGGEGPVHRGEVHVFVFLLCDVVMCATEVRFGCPSSIFTKMRPKGGLHVMRDRRSRDLPPLVCSREGSRRRSEVKISLASVS